MLKSLPLFISFLFILTTALTFLFFIAAVRRTNSHKASVSLAMILLGWLLLQAILGSKHFYTVTDTMPPRFILLVAPPLLSILVLFITKRGRRFVDAISLKILTQLHIVRVFVELILLWLFIYRVVPREMTFEGRNFDILMGVTAPFVVYFGFMKHRLGSRTILLWNVIGIIFLLNIVVIAILAAPFPFQQLAFDQPNIAVLYFPFVWLPCFIVPVVLFSHLVAVRRLLKSNSNGHGQSYVD